MTNWVPVAIVLAIVFAGGIATFMRPCRCPACSARRRGESLDQFDDPTVYEFMDYPTRTIPDDPILFDDPIPSSDAYHFDPSSGWTRGWPASEGLNYGVKFNAGHWEIISVEDDH